MTANRWQLLERIWSVRECFICLAFGRCQHREIEVDCAQIDAYFAHHPESATPLPDNQLWLPGIAPAASAEVQRVH